MVGMIWKVLACLESMHRINGDGKPMGQPANPGLPEKWPLK